MADSLPAAEFVFVIFVTQARVFPAASQRNRLWVPLRLPQATATFSTVLTHSSTSAARSAVGRCFSLAALSSSVGRCLEALEVARLQPGWESSRLRLLLPCPGQSLLYSPPSFGGHFFRRAGAFSLGPFGDRCLPFPSGSLVFLIRLRVIFSWWDYVCFFAAASYFSCSSYRAGLGDHLPAAVEHVHSAPSRPP